LLPRRSNHSKLVKRGIMVNTLGNVLRKSCMHFVSSSLGKQIDRLCAAGYDFDLIENVLCSLYARLYGNASLNRPATEARVLVIPYYHRAVHCIIKAVKQFNVRVVFSVKVKLSVLTPFTNSVNPFTCSVNHRNANNFTCCKNIVYKLPLACGSSYIGQTARCLTVRLNEHLGNIRAEKEDSLIAKHITECNNCEIIKSDVRPLRYVLNRVERLIIEAFHILSNPECVSVPTVKLTHSQLLFLTNADK